MPKPDDAHARRHAGRLSLAHSRRAFLAASPFTVGAVWLLPGTATAQEEVEAPRDDIMGPVSARYGRLGSYRDQGVVETSYQWPGTPALVERHVFQTLFKAPRRFFFRFDQDSASGGDALVIWCDGGPFQSWWKATGVHTVYDGGRGAAAFLTAQSPTKDSASLVAPHLFPRALLPGPTSGLVEPSLDGEEDLDGRRCRRIVAQRRITGVVTQEQRPTVLWVDDDSLVRKVFTDTELGATEGLVDRRVLLIDPVADPELGDDLFVFTPPDGRP